MRTVVSVEEKTEEPLDTFLFRRVGLSPGAQTGLLKFSTVLFFGTEPDMSSSSFIND